MDGDDWRVEWAAQPNGNYLDNLTLTRDQANAYGDSLIWTLRIDGEILREWGLDPAEPFIWRVDDDGEIRTEQITRKEFEQVANSDRDDAFYAKQTLEYRARSRQRRLERGDPV